jgi:DNA-binding MarR family transcriptional regulator/N-acetylglutamate synthase-like GNAT family acetyltransferase
MSNKEDFLNELAELALGSRLKRMSEKMLASAAEVYQTFNMNIQPKWFTLLALLDSKGQTTIVEASNLLGLSQPALSQFCKQLDEAGLVRVTVAKQDSRRREMSLTNQGKAAIVEMKPIWAAVEKAAKAMCQEFDNDFYRSLINLEKAFDKQDLLSRTKAELDKQAMNSNITIHPFSSELAPYFESINKQWIKQMFVLEDIDKKVLQQPQEYIIDKGGKIWFAEHPTLGVVGACALLNKGNGNYELTKMGVLDSARGLKVGERLLQFVIQQASKMQVSTLFLLTNAKCEAAIHLYEKNGFVHDRDIMNEFGKSYERCNVAMRFVSSSVA